MTYATSSGWTSGFFPGMLWQLANYTGEALREAARARAIKIESKSINKSQSQRRAAARRLGAARLLLTVATRSARRRERRQGGCGVYCRQGVRGKQHGHPRRWLYGTWRGGTGRCCLPALAAAPPLHPRPLTPFLAQVFGSFGVGAKLSPQIPKGYKDIIFQVGQTHAGDPRWLIADARSPHLPPLLSTARPRRRWPRATAR